MEAHAEQDIVLVLMDKNVYDLSDGSGKCAAVVGMKDCLSETGAMVSDDSSQFLSHWDVCDRRDWANSEFYNSLPQSFRPLLRQVKIIASNGQTGGGKAVSDDYCFLAAEKEVFGTNTYANSDTESELKAFEYYSIAANQRKSADYYERSSYIGQVAGVPNRSVFCVTNMFKPSFTLENRNKFGISVHMAL